MNYYAELGVRHDASEREIRQAYRVLVRLLHPDTQTGEDLRRAAERQLSRLNEMLEVLTNADKRRAYDHNLELGWPQADPIILPISMPRYRKPPESVSAMAGKASWVARLALKYWAIVLIGVVIVGAVALSTLMQGNGEAPASRTEAVPQQSHPAAAPKKVASESVPPSLLPNQVIEQQAEAVLPPAAPRWKGSGRAVIPLKAAPPSSSAPSALSEPQASGSNPEPATNESEAAAQEPARTHVSLAPATSFSGNWFYTTDLAAPAAVDGYRAVYVELLLTENDGMLSGNYRARYLVPDKAISPQVTFHLQGRSDSERKAHAEWSSASGARGEAELNVSTPGVMEFRWWSTALGSQIGLSSGTAKLIRQRTP